MKVVDMLNVLKVAETQLPGLLQDESLWNSLLIDYDFPLVERVWMQWSDYRICLHAIHPCEPNQSLFHPHPWPSAMKVIEGAYEMETGYGAGEEEPPKACKLILTAGSRYEMTLPDAWHYVRPIGGISWSLMLIGKPWERNSPKSDRPLHPLSAERKLEILNFFRERYVE